MKFAIAGATGAVGDEFLAILANRGIDAGQLRLLASARSAGKKIAYRGTELTVAEMTAESFDGIDVAFFSAGGGRSREYAPHAVKSGAVVIDNSSAYRMDPDVPLVVPEVNPDDVFTHKGIIANPNCSTIIMLMAVAPIYRAFGVERIVCSTYQASSGAGRQAMLELEQQSRDLLDGNPITANVLPHQAAFNIFNHNSGIDESGYNEEERKMVNESRKILHDNGLRISATCVRVPVPRAHSESINLTLANAATPDEVRAVLDAAPGVRVVDDRENNYFPMPIDASGKDEMLVGRIRQDMSQPDGRGIELFISGDQLRKGAALNAVQIADVLAKSPIGTS